jgi:O-antigen/teichoic acid export membrane protein
MADVGLFSRANGLVEIFNRIVMRSVMQVCMPYFARSDRESGSVKAAYLRSVSYLTAVGWPFMAALAVAAFAAIRLIYGPQWTSAVQVAQLLCLACAIELTHALSREALLACGAARQSASLQVVIVLLQIGGLAAGASAGLVGAGWGLVAASAIGVLVAQWQLARTINLSISEMAHHCLPSLYLMGLTVAPIALWSALEGVSESNYIRFGLIGGLVTAATWLVAMRLLRHPFANEIAILIQGTFSKLRRFT